MKHQYFGDIIDLFKYDLMTTLTNDLKLNGITFIPMLTEDDKSNEGGKRNFEKAKAGTQNKTLIEFLTPFKDPKVRDAKKIKTHFDSIEINFKFYSDRIFLHKERDDYFSEIDSKNFENEHLFFDPDNGLEISKSNHKHVLFTDIAKCYTSMDDNSIISVIQFRPRVKWEIIIPQKIEKLNKFITPHITYIADNNIAFFILTKNKRRLNEVQKSLDLYKKNYQSLIIKYGN